MVLWRIKLASLVVLLGTGSVLSGNTFATVTGIVSSRSGTALPDVAVEAIEAGSGYRYTGQSNDSGTYTLPDLREGTYRIHASHPGFVDWIAEGVELRPHDVRRVDITLAVPAVDAKVEATSGAYLIEAESDGISGSKNHGYIQRQPATVRRPWGFVNEVGQVRVLNLIRYAASRTRQGQQALDGIANEKGDASLNMRTRGGTNELYGRLFDYDSTPGLAGYPAEFSTWSLSAICYA